MLLSGLGAAAVELNAHAALALLDAFQRQGWFRATGEARTMGELCAGCVAAYARFLPEAIGILQGAGGPAQLRRAPCGIPSSPPIRIILQVKGEREVQPTTMYLLVALGVQQVKRSCGAVL